MLPVGIASIPTGIGMLLAGMTSIPVGIVLIPEGMTLLPAGTASLPTGKTTIPAGKITLPAGKYLKNLKISRLLFCRGDRGGHRHRGRGRIGGAMVPRLAADVLKFLGGGRAFAQQTGHGINHSAGIVVGGITGGLQIRRGLDMRHLVFLLDRRKRAHCPQFPLQPGDVRRDIKIFRRQSRLVVGVLHVTDDLADDAYLFSKCVHDVLLVDGFGVHAIESQPARLWEEPGLANPLHFLACKKAGRADLRVSPY